MSGGRGISYRFSTQQPPELGRSADVVAARVADSGDPVPRSGLGEYAVYMGLDRVIAQVKTLGDLRIGQAAADQGEDFHLAVRQAVRRRRTARIGGPL